MDMLLIILLLLLFAVASAASVWALALLVYEERWKLFFLGLLLPPAAAAWLFREGYRMPPHTITRYLLEGILLAATLFLPIWITGIVFMLLIMLETFVIFAQAEEDEEDDQADE